MTNVRERCTSAERWTKRSVRVETINEDINFSGWPNVRQNLKIKREERER